METLSKNKIKWIRSLALKKNREKESLFIVEGEKMVEEIIQLYSDRIEFVISNDKLFNKFETAFFADDRVFKQISSFKTPNKLIAIVKTIENKPVDSKGLVLMLDGIQDPGNMGTILRSADWFDVKSIICSKTCVDIYNPKVIQASMGAIFRMDVRYEVLTDFIVERKLPVYGALLEGENVYTTKILPSAILVLGNEGNGISDEVQKLIDYPIHIPRFGKSESLNVAVAAGILLSEFGRIR